MPSSFFDSSALVKRYFREAGTGWVRTECGSAHNTVYISELALTEVVITLHKKAWQNRSFRRVRDAVIAGFRQDAASGAYKVIAITPHLLEQAGDLGAHHGIGSQDAIQLACALDQAALLRGTVGDNLLFVSADTDLIRFARDEGLHLAINPADMALPSEKVVRHLSWRERMGNWCDAAHKRRRRLLRGR